MAAIYVVDTNFFIQAYRSFYPLDVALSFWSKVKSLAESGIIISIDKVRDELYDKNDELEAWCKSNLPDNFFKDTATIMTEYGRVTSWAYSMKDHYLPNALNEFLAVDEADAFLIAYTLADTINRSIVTQELSEPNRKNKIKIPDSCKALDVKYLNVMDMFRALGETF